MLLRGTAAESFPQFRDYLYNRFPNVIESSKIVIGMESYGNLNESQFRAALHPGAQPIVDVGEVGSAEAGTYLSCELGQIRDGNFVLVGPLISSFEEGPWYKQNYFKNAKGQDVPIVGAVLLHLLCHWGWVSTKSYPSGDTDTGYDFEKFVYGTRARWRLTSPLIF